MSRFTDTWLRNLKPEPKRRDYTEPGHPGFMLRLWPSGEKSFVYRYQRNGKTKILTFGTYPQLSLGQAHELHTAARKVLAAGRDPIEERASEAKVEKIRAQHEKVEAGITTRSVLAEFAWHHLRRGRKNPREVLRVLRVYIANPWKERAVRDITRRDAVILLDKIKGRGSPVMANRIFNLANQAFMFAIKRDLITNNPFIGLDRPGGTESPRERNLNDDEIRSFWQGLDAKDCSVSRPVSLALKLVLTTGQRPGEVASAEWTEIDTNAAQWNIPAEKSKNGRAHVVPLSALALEILGQLRTLAKGRPCVLPSTYTHERPDEATSRRSLARALRVSHKDERLFGCEPFTAHDLRRTAASGMTRIGIQRLHVSKVLNHSDRDVTGRHYDKNDYAVEKERALTQWAEHLREVVSGKKVKVSSIRRNVA